jgi:hypothetical protein
MGRRKLQTFYDPPARSLRGATSPAAIVASCNPLDLTGI